MQRDPRLDHPSYPARRSDSATPDTPALVLAMQQASSQHAVGRRRALALLGAAAGAAVLAACSSNGSSGATAGATDATNGSTGAAGTTPGSTAATAGSTADSTGATTAGATPVDVEAMPAETGGPFAADGSNDNGAGEVANVLTMAGVIRSDIRSDIGGGNEQPGAPMSLEVTVIDTATGLPRAGAAVYVWHCNQAGGYSGYNSSMLGGDFSEVTWLRGVQVADANGRLTFQTILPGRYPGRAAHIHFAVYSDETYSSELLISQMAFDDDGVDALYTSAGYADALDADTDNDDDGVFRDGWALQTLTLGGDATSGITASIVVGV